jgi:transcriptional regulator with XRE-family HTH domain
MAAALNPTWTLGDKMNKARRACGMEQADIAHALGVSRAQVSKWERDISEPAATQAVKFASLTGVTLEWLLGVTVGELVCGGCGLPDCAFCSPLALGGSYAPVAGSSFAQAS